MKLTAEIIEAFAGVYLSPRYDAPQPTPPFHRECWERYCSDVPAAATAAPRNHAKSTGLTHDYVVANCVFRTESYIIIIGSSEDLAVEHLGDIANEFRENEQLISAFAIKGFIVEQKTDIIVECHDGHQFRIIARGAEQKIRGRKWRGKRPGLIIFDDIEDDEQVESRERRKKFRKWFFRACKPALRDGGRIRGHGTILHEDSLLSHLMKNKSWASKLYRAHAGFDDFSEILWPEKFPVERLKAIRQEFLNEGDSAGYSQEYLNDPFDNDSAFLRSTDFLPMREEDYETFKVFAVGTDFAVSKGDSANRSAFVIGGKDINNILHHVDVRVGRMDTLEIVEELFSIQQRWNPDVFFVEDGVIWKAIAPILYSEMRDRDTFLSIKAILPVKDKKVRARSYQKRMRAGGCRFDKRAEWYEGYESENLRFTGEHESILDDQFDATAILHRGFEEWAPVTEEDSMDDEELAFERELRLHKWTGRSTVTGY